MVWKTMGKLPLRHDGDFDDMQTCMIGALTTKTRSNWGTTMVRIWTMRKSLCATTGNLHDLQNKGIDHCIHAQLEKLHGRKNHGNQPLHHEGNVDDLDELQLRNFRSFLV